ncbi:IS630 family transposase [Streptomyces sp. P38-E01]|uniref:IS630 family transposase n=1 Tax=Streptomyces tardus TaxID=2780544 RepID=A0A949JEB0_9ACTN|nr:IS630 family transposase [Streptomyces tardus]MBU7596597.1 IS630 family transposase [Streptomyces tardus]MBU7597403.1 IS630 family transposase [Streptomyces tardus]MBU7598868.1 IS630 family transposase [Streptomyces tardus]MBU7600362.1 IS630 family transposase [Streptomyces tardus]
MPGPKPLSLELSERERRVLRGWLRKRTAGQALVLRARIVLACAEGRPNARVAQELGISRETVRKWRSRFAADRLEGLIDAPRSGAPRQITDEQVESLVARTLDQAPPSGDSHWSTRSMAQAAGMSQSAVSRIWRAFGLKPHIVQTWKLSTDPQFVTKVRDVVGIYLSPPANALVLAVDEKSQIQALDRTQPVLPLTPGTPARMTHDYVRHGTTSLFAALDIASGSVIAQHYRRHRQQEFLRFLKTIDAAVPKDLDLHLVLDNYATHKTEAVKKWLLRHPRFHLHFTPTSASWLNLVERWFAELTCRKLRRSAHRSVIELERDIRGWINEWNKNPKPFVWTKTADEILKTLAAYCTRTTDSGH